MDLVGGAVGSIIRKLGELLRAEYKLQAGLPKQIESLRNELESAQTALQTAGQVPPEQLNPQVQLWARDVREASYDMEDILDTFLVKLNAVEEAAAVGRTESKDRLHISLGQNMANLCRMGKARHTIAGAIKDMEKRLQDVADRRDRYSVPVSVPAPAMKLDPRLVDMHKEAGQLIGIDKARAELIALLGLSSPGHGGDAHVSGSGTGSGSSRNKMKIVSVVGAGGLGKTTLAKAIYNELKPGYDSKAFMSVGRKPDLVQVFTSIFFLLDRKEYEAIHGQKSLSLLIDQLKKFLRNKRYFIVIDDVWEVESWEAIKLALDQNNSASKVITTTRNRDVATEEVYELHPLSHDNSRKLFYMRLFGGEGKCPSNHPHEASKKILDKCGGVPLAIITMASLLVGKSGEDWTEVCNSPSFYRGGKDNKQVDDTVWILSLSYYDLPSDLKTCLLYLSVYPEDYLIKKDSLIWKWIAEGFVEKKAGTSLFQRGEEYFHRLINRSMIDAVGCEESGIIYGCRVHDMVLDLIRDLSNEENFITVPNYDGGTWSGKKVRRLVHHKRIMKQTHEGKNMGMSQVRTLLAYRCNIGSRVIHVDFKLLRVLALERCTSYGSYSLEHLGQLLHLRYLGLRELWVEKLPEEIGALRLLQTLDLEGTHIEVEKLPPSVWLLTQLLCLRCDSSTSVPDGFPGKVTLLEELHICPPETNGESMRQFYKELGNLKELRVLRVLPSIGGLDPSMQSDLAQSLSNLRHLQHLELMGNFIAIDKSAACEWDTDTALLPRHLRHLSIKNIWFPQLPSCINPAHLLSLSHLDLHVDHVDDAALRSLSRLPELRYLNLLAPYWLRAPCKGNKSRVSNITIGAGADGSFRKLRCCKLDGWMVQLALNDDDDDSSASVSFSIWNCEGVTALGSKAKDCCSRVAPAAVVVVMPNLLELQFCVPVGALYKDGDGSCGNLGFEYLASLHKVKVVVNCEDAFEDDVEKAVAELKQAAELHPNRPILEIDPYYEEMMLAR